MTRRRSVLSENLANRAIVVALAAGLVAGCVGTPMPIPPSLQEDQVTLELASDPCPYQEEMGGECVAISGGAGAVEAGATLIITPLFPPVTPFDAPFAIAIADARGAFDVPSLGASPESGFRTIVHAAASTEVLNLFADTGAPPPWPVEARSDEEAGVCLALSPSAVDFGSVAVGATATGLVRVTNTCAEARTFYVNWIASSPEGAVQPPFGALSRYAELAQDESVDVVVAFWPEEVADFVGAIVFDSTGVSGGAETLVSVAVRGRAFDR
jgi:hypothetical protein